MGQARSRTHLFSIHGFKSGERRRVVGNFNAIPDLPGDTPASKTLSLPASDHLCLLECKKNCGSWEGGEKPLPISVNHLGKACNYYRGTIHLSQVVHQVSVPQGLWCHRKAVISQALHSVILIRPDITTIPGGRCSDFLPEVPNEFIFEEGFENGS